MSVEAPLGLENLFVNTIAGNSVIFVFLATLLFSLLAIKMRMNTVIFGMLMGIFAILFSKFIPVGIVVFFGVLFMIRIATMIADNYK